MAVAPAVASMLAAAQAVVSKSAVAQAAAVNVGGGAGGGANVGGGAGGGVNVGGGAGGGANVGGGAGGGVNVGGGAGGGVNVGGGAGGGVNVGGGTGGGVFSCMPNSSVCALNVNSVTLSGALTVNNAPPVLKTLAVNGNACTDYTNRVAVLRFKNLASGTSTSATVSCANPAVYSVLLVAGTYEVRITNGGGANVPGPESILNSSLAITSTATQNFNVNSVTVSGALTVNNAPPVLKTLAVNGNACTDYTNRVAVLTFKNLTSGNSTSATVSCSNPAVYSVLLVAGTYEVRISNGGGANVPGPESILSSSLAIASTATQNFNVNSVTVSGALTVNNAPPILKTLAVNGNACTDYTNRVAVLTFKNLASGNSTSATVSCANPAAYSVLLVAGTYEVRITNGGGANVPGPESILSSSLAITSTATQNFNVNSVTVSGALTVNNAPPVLKTLAVNGNACTDYTNRVAVLTFKNLTSGNSTSATVSCSNPAVYSVLLVAGTYEVRITNGGGANVPGPESILNSSLAITSTATQHFNVNSVTVSGALTVNNAPPILKTLAVNGNACTDYTNRVAVLTFKNLTSGNSTSATVSCANPAAYSVLLVAGTYEVRISNGGGANVPGPESILNSSLAITSTATQSFNVNSVTVSGALTVNNAAARTQDAGGEWQRVHGLHEPSRGADVQEPRERQQHLSDGGLRQPRHVLGVVGLGYVRAANQQRRRRQRTRP